MFASQIGKVVGLLTISNLFMLSAWYLHLRLWGDRAWYIAAFLSWCIAGFEYMAHIPANRIGNTVLTLPQLQILQIGMSLLFFIPFASLVLKRHIGLNYLWASICLVGAAFFIFRESTGVSKDAHRLAHAETPSLASPPVLTAQSAD
jgi:uncharacterized protein (DUF486 family)